MKQQLKLLLVDFDGVLSNGRFYASTNDEDMVLGKMAANTIFTDNNEALLKEWMRGKRTYADIHDFVERETGVDARQLDRLLQSSVKQMPLNQSMIDFVKHLSGRGVTVSLLTDNMDIFDTVSRKFHGLDNYFSHIYSSSAYGQMKLENDALIKIALQDAGVTSRDNVALVDDSQNSYNAAVTYGIKPFLYKDYDKSQAEFETWLQGAYDY